MRHWTSEFHKQWSYYYYYYHYYYYYCVLLVSRNLDMWKGNCDKLLFPHFLIVSFLLYAFFCFSDNQGATFFFLRFLWFPSSVLQWHEEEEVNFLLESTQFNWLKICTESLFSPLCSRTSSLLLSLTISFSSVSSSTSVRGSANISPPVFIVSVSLSHRMHFSKYYTWQFSPRVHI